MMMEIELKAKQEESLVGSIAVLTLIRSTLLKACATIATIGLVEQVKLLIVNILTVCLTRKGNVRTVILMTITRQSGLE